MANPARKGGGCHLQRAPPAALAGRGSPRPPAAPCGRGSPSRVLVVFPYLQDTVLSPSPLGRGWGGVASMPWVVGIDEAGYGPNLGPLVQAAVALRLPESDQAGWDTLKPVVRRCGERHDSWRLLIDDSKPSLHVRRAGHTGRTCPECDSAARSNARRAAAGNHSSLGTRRTRRRELVRRQRFGSP